MQFFCNFALAKCFAPCASFADTHFLQRASLSLHSQNRNSVVLLLREMKRERGVNPRQARLLYFPLANWHASNDIPLSYTKRKAREGVAG